MEKKKRYHPKKEMAMVVPKKKARAKPIYIATKTAVVRFSEGRHITLNKGRMVNVSKEELTTLKRMKFIRLL